MDYTITKISEFPGGLHVEYEFINPIPFERTDRVTGEKIEEQIIEHMEMNFGPDMIARDVWKSHLDDYVLKLEAYYLEKKAASESKVPGARADPYAKFLGPTRPKGLNTGNP